MIVGTAGHIDHGKTTLVRALTGVDTDRLPEEKARGMSIELGYAYLDLPGGSERIGFIDVPGHERLVRTMLAGATGIDFALLLVAADDGVMAQTREHVAVLSLLGLSRGAVALTKIDRVEASRIEQVRRDIAALLADTPLATAPVLPVSALGGDGVEALRDLLFAAAGDRSDRLSLGATSGSPSEDDSAGQASGQNAGQAAGQAAGRAFRLAIDRSFTLPGTGTVVTGTVHAGRLRVGDEVMVAPPADARRARVRSLHAQDRPVAEARYGQRCAVALAAVGRDEVARGQWLVAAEVAVATQRLDALLTVWPGEARPLRSGTPVHVHIGATDVLGTVTVLQSGTGVAAANAGAAAAAAGAGVGVGVGAAAAAAAAAAANANADADADAAANAHADTVTVSVEVASAVPATDHLVPGGRGFVQVLLREPVAAWRGDRIVLRDASASRTLAGGIVLDPFAPARYRRTPQRLAELAGWALPTAASRLARLIESAPHGVSLGRWARAEGLSVDHAAPLPPGTLRAGESTADDWALGASHQDSLLAATLAALRTFHAREPELLGPDAGRLRRLVAPRLPEPLWRALLGALQRDGRLTVRGAYLHLPEHALRLSATDERLAQRIAPLLVSAGFDGCWARDLARTAGESEALMRTTLARLAQRGELHQVVRDLCYSPATIARLVGEARRIADADGGAVTARRFRDATGLGRKRAIQILEYFDRIGLLRRVGDAHRLRRDSAHLTAETA